MLATVRRWPREEQDWWRELLGVAPHEALLIARLCRELDGRPIKESARGGG